MWDAQNECMMVNTDMAEEYFMGKLINPSITPTRGSNPGYTTLDYDSSTDRLENVQQTFLSLDSAAGLPKNAAFTDFEYLYVDYAEDFGLEQLSSADIAALNQRLLDNDSLYEKYASNKMGFANKTGIPSLVYYSCLQMNSMFMREAEVCYE